MDCENEKPSDTSMSSTSLETSSSPKRLRLDNSEEFQCDETRSCEESIDSNLTISNEEKTSEITSHESPMKFDEILTIMIKNMTYVQSWNDLQDFPSKTNTLVNTNFSFVIEPYSWTETIISGKLQQMMNDSYADYEKAATTCNDMFDAPWNKTVNDQSNQVPANVSYTEEQVKSYLEMKVILKTKNFHVCVLTGESGTGKTVFLKQFCDDPDIHFIYIAAQNSLRKEGCRKLDLDFDSDTMTLAGLTMMIFNFDFTRYKSYRKILNMIPIEKIEEIGLPGMFELFPNSLDLLFTLGKRYPTGNQELVLCIDKFNIINTNELYMIKRALERLVSAAKTKVNVILLLCGNPFKIQPIFVSASADDDELSKGNFAVGGSDAQRRVSRNATSTVKLGQTHFEFKHGKRSDNAEYQTFLHNLKSSATFGDDVLKFFEDAFKVHEIPYKYCIEALLDMPTPNPCNPVHKPGVSYLCDVAGWVQKYGKNFNGVAFYSYRNTEAHYMNLSIALSAWQQCQLFNDAAAQRGDKEIPPYLMPRLVPIYFADTAGQLSEGAKDKLEKMPVLPLIIGCRYKVLHSEMHLKLGEIVTLVHVEYEDKESYKKFVIFLP